MSNNLLYSTDYRNYGLHTKTLFNKLRRLYDNNDYYAQYPNVKHLHGIKSLRGVVNRSVEFYVSKIASDMKVSTDNQNVQDAIDQVWQWSNFEEQKSTAIRYMALYGNLFYKVCANQEKVWFEIVDPRYISALNVNSRGYITEIRIDIPMTVDNVTSTFTEYWNKQDGYMATWIQQVGENASLEELGTPTFSAFLSELGLDFVPFVQIKFKNIDISNPWGAGSTEHCLDKIDQANREASRLSDMQFRFNKPMLAVSANSKDAQGRPIPAPKIKTDNKEIFSDENETSIVYIPGEAKIDTTIPNINYAEALNILNATMAEIREDLPELRYYTLSENQVSGKALEIQLGSAVSRALEAQKNFLSGIERVDEIALTLGSFWNLFVNIGSYQAGDFEHEIVVPDMFPASDAEKATILKTLTDSGVPLDVAMRKVGFSEDEITSATESQQRQQAQTLQNQQVSLAQGMMAFNRGA